MKKNSCTKCGGSGKTRCNCVKVESVTVQEKCRIKNCKEGRFAPTCRSCRGKGCDVCQHTGLVIFDQAKRPGVTPIFGTHVQGKAVLTIKCKNCRGTGMKSKTTRVLVKQNNCIACGGSGRSTCTGCGGTGVKELGNHIEIPSSFQVA